MRPIHRGTGLFAGAVLSAAALAACAGSKSAPPATSAPKPSTVPGSTAESYDWHPLIVVHFGTLLKDMPFALSEVLMFNDPAHPERADADKDCYAMKNASPPEWLGRRPDDYLFCFEHDRLHRIEASVHLPSADAPQVFSAACMEWQRQGRPAARTADRCDGRDGPIAFSARLAGDDSGTAESSAQASSTVSISVIEAVSETPPP